MGKSLVAEFLKKILEFQGKKVVKFSIDDFYLTFKQRRSLRAEKPFIKYRGPPGTHDVEMALDIISKFKNKEKSIEIPIFEKTLYEGRGDRNGFETVEDSNQTDIVIFEGWFVGLSHIRREDFPERLKSDSLARFSNKHLKKWKNWDFLDTLIALKPQDFQYSIEWRKQAERSKGGMTEEEVEKFVKFYLKAIEPEAYYGKLAQDGEEGLNKLGMLVEFGPSRNIASVDFFDNY